MNFHCSVTAFALLILNVHWQYYLIFIRYIQSSHSVVTVWSQCGHWATAHICVTPTLVCTVHLRPAASGLTPHTMFVFHHQKNRLVPLHQCAAHYLQELFALTSSKLHWTFIVAGNLEFEQVPKRRWSHLQFYSFPNTFMLNENCLRFSRYMYTHTYKYIYVSKFPFKPFYSWLCLFDTLQQKPGWTEHQTCF